MINIEHGIEYGMYLILGFATVCPKIGDAHNMVIFIRKMRTNKRSTFGIHEHLIFGQSDLGMGHMSE